MDGILGKIYRQKVCFRMGRYTIVGGNGCESELVWFVWREGQYDRLCPNTEGVIRSQCFPGLWLAVDALLQDERSRLLAVVQAGLQTAEHQAFVQRLRSSDRMI